MTIRLIPSLGGGGGSEQLVYTDNFQEPNNNFGAGNGTSHPWAASRTQSAANVNFFRILGNQLEWIFVQGTGDHQIMFYPLKGGPLGGRNHLSRIVIAADTGGGPVINRYGPSVLMTGAITNEHAFYYISVMKDLTNSYAVVRVVNGVETTLVTSSSNVYGAFPVTLELGQIVNPGNVQLTVKTNGVVTDVFTDTDVTRPVAGVPGIFGKFGSAGVHALISQYVCAPA